MPIREIRFVGDPVLRTAADPVSAFDRDLRRLIDDMFVAMSMAEGVGLAAPQIGVGLRVFIYEVGGRRGHVVNPTLSVDDPTEVVAEEGCLSVPGRQASLGRFAGVTVHGLDRLERPVATKARGTLARCFQHEVDHLDGRLYVDRLPPALRRKVLLDLDPPS